MNSPSVASGSRPGRDDFFEWAVFGGWCGIVLLVASRHEFWRDEVRALSLSIAAHTPLDLPALLANEGHPILWYSLLWLGYRLTGCKCILPIAAFLIAAAAVYLFIRHAPFSRPWKLLFVFGGLPLYEYSVVARNYGLSLLLMFAFARGYASRSSHPLWLGVLLALLCSANVHSVPLACALMIVWVWDDVIAARNVTWRPSAAGMLVAALLVTLSIAAAVHVAWPTEDTDVSNPSRYTASEAVQAVLRLARHPSRGFGNITPQLPGVLGVLPDIVLIGATFGLARRPHTWALAVAGLVALGVVFDVVYPGGYRHEGLFVVFLVTLYWIELRERGPIAASSVSGRIGRVALVVLLAGLLVTGATRIYNDVLHEQSASLQIGRYLNQHPDYGNAILIGEPDYALESVPYYAPNAVYVVREHRFSDVVHFVRSAEPHLSLGGLLRAAWDLQERTRRPVLLFLGHLDTLTPASATTGAIVSDGERFRRTFSWSADDVRAWNRCTRPIARFADNVLGDERFVAYRLATEVMDSVSHCP